MGQLNVFNYNLHGEYYIVLNDIFKRGLTNMFNFWIEPKSIYNDIGRKETEERKISLDTNDLI